MTPRHYVLARLLLCLGSFIVVACAQSRRDRTPSWYFPDAGSSVCSLDECIEADDAASLDDATLDAALTTDASVDANSDDASDAAARSDASDSDAGCTSGYAWNADTSVCRDVDECAKDNGGCGDATFFRCVNRPGSQPECADIDECAAPGACHGYACTNLVGAPPLCASNCPGDSDDARGDGSLCLARIQQVSANESSQCALLTDGSLRCWGRIGSAWMWPTEKFTQIALGSRQACGLTQSELVCWSLDAPGNVTRVADSGRKLLMLDNGSSLLLHHDGSLASAPDAGVTYRDIDTYASRICAIEASGKLVCWGAWNEEQLALAAAIGQPGFSAVAVGYRHVCGLREDGRLACFNMDPARVADPGAHVTGPNAESANDFIQVGVGAFHSCGLHKSGKVQCWGASNEEVTGPNESSLRFARITVHRNQTCGFTQTNAMRCWGDGLGLLQHANGVRAVKLTTDRPCAIRGDGSIACSSADTPRSLLPEAPPGANLRDFVSTYQGACVLWDDGRLACWGSATMTAIDEANKALRFVSLVANHNALCGLQTDGGARCFQTSPWSQSGFVDSFNADGGRYRALSLGDFHACALRESGRLACWGSEGLSVSGPNASSASFVSVTAGEGATCAQSSSGRITCWGEKQVEFEPTSAQDFSQLTLRHFGLFGLRKDGSIYAYDVTGAPISSGFEWLPQRFTQLMGTSDGVCALSEAGEVVCRGQYYLDGSALVTASR